MKPLRFILIALLPLVTIAADAAVAPLKELAGITPTDAAFQASTATKPIVIKTAKEAAGYFTAAELAKLAAQVDFANQIVLVFAWQGSGGDKLEFAVAESFPEQVHFTYTPGRTRDLQQHTHIYALRSNVTWSVK